MSVVVPNVLDRTIDLGELGTINALWHCFGVKHEIVGFDLACRMLDESQTALLPINTNQHRALIGHGDVTWDNFKYEADKRQLVPCLNINLQTSAAKAVAQAEKFRDVTGISLLKLEVLDADDDSVSDDTACVAATEILADDGFCVMPLISDCPAAAAALDVPLLRVMGSPIGSGAGILNPDRIDMICDDADVPVILDGGIGSVAHAHHALELGCAGFLVNSTLFAVGADPAEKLAEFKAAFS